MRSLITGGAGFIGHHLATTLIDRGDPVRILDSFATGFRSRLEPLLPSIELIEGDIRRAKDLDKAMEGCDVVFHLAAIPSVLRSMRDPGMTNDVNVNGTVEVILAAARGGVRRVVFAGSSAVYGNSPELPRREAHLPDPLSPYAVSKLAGEHYLHVIGSSRGVETVVLRYFNVFGGSQDPESEYAAVVPRFVTAGLRGERPLVYGDGTQSRDFTHVDNVAAANLLASTAPGVSGLTFNIGCGGRYTLLELLHVIGEAIGTPLEPTFLPAREGDVPHSQADISRAADGLGYRVIVPFKEGVHRTVAWYRDRQSPGSST